MAKYSDEEHGRSKYKTLVPYVALAVLFALTIYVWRLRCNAEAAAEQWVSWGILAIVFVISLLIFSFIQTIKNTHKRAVSLAHEMTLALRESESRFRELFNNAPDGVIIVNSEGKIVLANTQAKVLFGYSQDEFVSMPVETLIPSRYSNHAALRQGYMHNTPYIRPVDTERKLSARRKDGSEFPVAVVLSPVESDTCSQVMATVRDITALKQAEADRIAREVAEADSRAKSAFVANMSHEIRTPLNAILGFAQILERDPLLTPRQAEHVHIISRSGSHLLRLINDILDMAKIEAGQATLNEATFCLHDLVDDLEMMFHARANAKGLQLFVERDDSVPSYVSGDESKLRQVFINLVGNAVKFTKIGGVTVRVHVETVEGIPIASKQSLRLVAEVEDTGPGIPDKDISRVFKAFQQSDVGVEAGGTGLGLSLSRKFVEMMGGQLRVMSQVGNGSSFRFEVLLTPAKKMAEREHPSLRRVVALERGTGPYRILVVDDMPDNRSLMRELLQPVGFEVAEASNGAEALEVFGHWSPHAIVMDVHMSVMDGYEVIRRLKATEAGHAVPIIAVTASVFEDQEALVLATGVVAYMRKPFQAEELFTALGKCLGLRYVFADEITKTMSYLKPAFLAPETLAALPKALVQAMQQAVAEGDIARLKELISQVEKVDSKLARWLQALAKRYDYKKLSQWLEKEAIANG